MKTIFWKRFKKNHLAVLGGIIVFFLFLIAILAPVVSPHDPNSIDVKNILEPPSIRHPFGTDDLGRDIMSRIIWGSRISLAVGFVAVMIAIGLTSWMGVARLVRAEFLSVKEREFVLAARTVGANDIRIIFNHILPNSIAPVLVSTVLGIAGAILVESALSFLGIGIQ